jgi:hypothetical protein
MIFGNSTTLRSEQKPTRIEWFTIKAGMVEIEVSSDLTDWSQRYMVPPGATSNPAGVSVQKNSPSAGKDTITLTLPATGAKQFARIKVTR